MSTTNRSLSTCKYCNQPYKIGFDGAFCSEVCKDKRQGEKVLNTVKHDHKYCYNCGTKLKEIETPPSSHWFSGWVNEDAIIGYQYPTPEADVGEQTRDAPLGELIHTGIICGECGNTRHFESFPELRANHLVEYAGMLLEVLESKADTHNKEIDSNKFFKSLIETGDLKLAIGVSIQ